MNIKPAMRLILRMEKTLTLLKNKLLNEEKVISSKGKKVKNPKPKVSKSNNQGKQNIRKPKPKVKKETNKPKVRRSNVDDIF